MGGGYMLAVGPCWSCGALFGFDPDLVPSMRDANGVRQAICRHCLERANQLRPANGLEPIVPLPGAYGPDT